MHCDPIEYETTDGYDGARRWQVDRQRKLLRDIIRAEARDGDGVAQVGSRAVDGTHELSLIHI
eukprot:9488226-Pyramimonas_sp.AAC.2